MLCCGNEMNGLCRIISNVVTRSVLLVAPTANTPSFNRTYCLYPQSNKELLKLNKMHFSQLSFRFNVRMINQLRNRQLTLSVSRFISLNIPILNLDPSLDFEILFNPCHKNDHTQNYEYILFIPKFTPIVSP